MKRSAMHGRMPMAVVTALVAIAVIVAGVRGSAQGAVLAALVGVLLIAYLVRHRTRARLVYDSPADHPRGTASRPAPDSDVRGTGDRVPAARPDRLDR